MKKLFLLPILFYISVFMGFAQEFSFPLYFEDALGNKDSVILGYSPNATNGLDTEFGEIDISNTEIDTNFAAYVTDIFFYEVGNNLIPDYKSKKQIIKYHSLEWEWEFIGQVSVDIICKNFPLKISWDNTLFEDISRSKSFIIIPPPGWWFDVGPSFDLLISDNYTNYIYDDFHDYANYYYDSILNEKIKVWQIYVGFADHNNPLTISQIDISNSFYSRVINNALHIDFGIEKSVTIQLLNMAGMPVYRNHVSAPATSIDMSLYPPGAYVVRIQEGEQVFSRIIIKK